MKEKVVLENTPLQEIDAKIRLANEFFYEKQLKLSKASSPRNEDLKMRIIQLKKLYYAVKDHQQKILDAMLQDFHRSPTETTAFEIIPLCNSILHAIDKLHDWVTPKRVKDNSPAFMLGNVVVEKIARGSALIIGPFNFPFFLSLTPVVYAIAAGNSVILKPSDLVPSSAKVLEQILAAADLPHGLIQVVQGSILETQRLVKSGKFDIIFFTGSPKVGSIIAQDAAVSLTPCVLELGGKSPAFITESFSRSHLQTALKRLFFSAFGNSGQICVTPDYVLVHESKYSEVTELAKQTLKDFFPKFDDDVEYTHLVNEKAYNDSLSKLESTRGRKLTLEGQHPEKANLFIPPTLVFDVDWDDSLMRDENFAPILPFIKYSNLDESIDRLLETSDTPLAQYIFSGSEHEIQQILARVRSGGCIVGDTMIHVGITDAPFGGIGSSGYGNHGGIYGFDTFTHKRTVLRQPFWMDFLLSMRYPPLTSIKRKSLILATEKNPWFDREGKNKVSLFQLIAAFGVIGLSIILYSYTT